MGDCDGGSDGDGNDGDGLIKVSFQDGSETRTNTDKKSGCGATTTSAAQTSKVKSEP